MRIAVWGTGWFAEQILDEALQRYEVVCFVDNKWERQGQAFYGIEILSPEDLLTRADEIDGILIGIGNLHEQRKIALQVLPMQGKKLGLFRNTIDFPTGDWNNLGWYDIGEKTVLPCKGCTHFANLFDDATEYDPAAFEEDMRILSEHLDIARIRLLGGEPLLSKNLNQYMCITRKYFPEADVYIVTNGLLLLQQEDVFFETLRANSIGVYISGYPPVMKRKEELVGKLGQERIAYVFGFEEKEFLRIMDFSRKNERVKSYDRCFHKACVFLRNGKLYNCPTEALVYQYNDYFDIKDFMYPVDDFGHDIHRKDRNWRKTMKQLYQAVPLCEYCSENGGELFRWEISKKPEKEDWCIQKREV